MKVYGLRLSSPGINTPFVRVKFKIFAPKQLKLKLTVVT